MVATVASIALLALTIAVAAGFTSVDGRLSSIARDVAGSHPSWRSAMSVVTHSADPPVLLGLAALVVVALSVRRRWMELLFVGVAAVVGVTARTGLLHLVARPRPADRLTPSAGYAFPSGHTTYSTLTAGVLIVLALALLRRGPVVAVVAVAASAWAVTVGVSRVALIAHWPTDVIAGWLLAVAVTVAASPIALARTAARP
ncbi:hypothetical protein GCM10009558_102850 [Virgisporangium aurantiacum]